MLGSDIYMLLAQQYYIHNEAYHHPRDRKPKSVLEPIRHPRYRKRSNSNNDKGRNTPHLAHSNCVSHLSNNGRDKEASCITRVHDTHVHEYSTIDLLVCEDAFGRAAAEDVHSSFSDIEGKAFEEERTFGGVQEGDGFGPIDDDEFEHQVDEDCEEAFDYEYPAPACTQ